MSKRPESALTAASTDQVLQELFKVADALLGLTNPEIVALRVAMGEWVRVVGQAVN